MPRSYSGPEQTAAALPPDTRIYAVGDIHGRADLLRETIGSIDDDLRRRPIKYAAEVYVGDYIDRGPDSKSVIDMLAVRLVQNHAICLRGNHEALMECFIEDASAFDSWQKIGGLQTLASYGVPLSETATAVDLQRTLVAALPRTHFLFLRCLRNSVRCGDFLFVHAGIRPNVALDCQDPNDLIWIRREFLDSTEDHGAFIVHGHTPVPHPDIRKNRINIDTGAWRSGVLTCVAIEGTEILVL